MSVNRPDTTPEPSPTVGDVSKVTLDPMRPTTWSFGTFPAADLRPPHGMDGPALPNGPGPHHSGPTLVAFTEGGPLHAGASGTFADDIFDEIVELAPEHRESVLMHRCQGDDALAREVRALLAAHDAAESRLSGDRIADPERLEPGQRLGPWNLAERLGQGASATVWKAFDTQLESWSALKVVHPRYSRAPHALDAVMSEARAASRIISDHVIRVKRAGLVDLPEDRQVHYVEMELCAEHRARADGSEELVVGETLADTAPNGHGDAARLVMEAAKGVDAAHRIGVLHRDIKPANILVTPVSRRALVADFGLSTPQLYPPPDPDTPATATVTVLRPNQHGVLVGTPAFMAPEQAFGHTPTRASDVYGLGATLYALLAGAPPYVPRPNAAIPALDVVAQVQEDGPAALRDLAPSVPKRLARIVEKAMSRSPRLRYPTAAALADDLALYLANRPTSVDGADVLIRSRLFVQRNRVVVTATTLLATVLVVFSAFVWKLDNTRQRIEAEMEAAVLHRDEAEELARAAEDQARHAEAARQEAIADARAALAAKDDAERREGEAQTTAQHELLLRLLAEEERARAQRKLAGESDLRARMESELLSAQDRIDQERLAREWTEVLLKDESEQRERAEHERAVLERALDEADARITELESALAAIQVAAQRAEAMSASIGPGPVPLIAPESPEPETYGPSMGAPSDLETTPAL